MKSRLEARMLGGLIFGVAVYAAIAIVGDAKALVSHLTSMGPEVFILALSLSVVNYSVRFAKWHVYLRALGCAPPLRQSLVVFLSGLSMSVTPGKFGEVVKSVLLNRLNGTPVARSAPVVVAERLTDLLGLMILAAVGLTSFDFGRLAFGGVAVVIIVFVVVAHEPRWVSRILDIFERLPLVGQHRARLDEAYGSMRTLLGLKILAGTTLMSAASWGMEAFAFWTLAKSAGGVLDFDLAMFVFSMTTILGGISFLPGGLGVTEGSMMGALMLFGAFEESSAAAAATYAIRLTTLWFAVVVGFFALAFFRTRIMPGADVFAEVDRLKSGAGTGEDE